MKILFKTNDEIAPLILRVFLATVMFPHGAQKALGLFGGHGFSGTMHFFTQEAHIPAALAFLVIATEFAGSIALFFGFLTRVVVFGMGAIMVEAIRTVHWQNGFFMNWLGNQKGEGFEYHILVLGIALALLIKGGGKWSIDGMFCRKSAPATK